MTQDEFTSHSHEHEGFARVVVDKHTWFELASMELHVWVRQAGKPAIDLDCLDGASYASGVCCCALDIPIDDVLIVFHSHFSDTLSNHSSR